MWSVCPKNLISRVHKLTALFLHVSQEPLTNSEFWSGFQNFIWFSCMYLLIDHSFSTLLSGRLVLNNFFFLMTVVSCKRWRLMLNIFTGLFFRFSFKIKKCNQTDCRRDLERESSAIDRGFRFTSIFPHCYYPEQNVEILLFFFQLSLCNVSLKMK